MNVDGLYNGLRKYGMYSGLSRVTMLYGAVDVFSNTAMAYGSKWDAN